MAYIYELGYGTYEESDFEQLTHRRKFSQRAFERMVLDCTVKAAAATVELHKENWEKDYLAGWDGDKSDTEVKSGRKVELEDAMRYRAKGDEHMYQHCVGDAYYMRNPLLTYQELHDMVVKLMCENYGFAPIVKLRRVSFFGWADLSSTKGFDGQHIGITKRAVRLIRKLVWKSEIGTSAEAKWSAVRKSALHKNPTACEAQDMELCKELGVPFVSYNEMLAAKESQDKVDKGDAGVF